MTRLIEWHETEMIEGIDQAVEDIEKKHGVTLESGYLDTFNAIHIVDWKTEVGDWLCDLVEALQGLQEEIDELPDDEKEEYEVTDDE